MNAIVLHDADLARYLRLDHPTRLLDLPDAARQVGVRRVLLKLESERPLGNFKVLGGVVAGIRALARQLGVANLTNIRERAAQGVILPSLICASDGNHGLAVSAAARLAGTSARVYLPAAVSDDRVARIEAMGARVVRVAGSYDEAVLQAAAQASRGGGLLVADTSADPDDPGVHDVMAGYGVMTSEIRLQMQALGWAPPTHLYIQAGVGGLAAALAQGFEGGAQASPRLILVEPEAAPCVGRALAAGHPVSIPTDLATVADMLSCGLACAAALRVLLAHAARSMVVTETCLSDAVRSLRAVGGPVSTPSGAAGWAGLVRAARDAPLREQHGLRADSSVLLIATEAALSVNPLLAWEPAPPARVSPG